MDTASWPQEIVVKPMEEIITNTTSATANTCSSALTTNNNNNNNNITNHSNTKPQPSTSLERKVRPQKDQALNCPRCNSTNTKFCYYNNYSLTQPRYFCKTCRRYWTEGGSLRNIPVGGGSRKNKRSSSSSLSSSTASKIKLPDLVVSPSCTNPNPKIHEGQDLNLGFPSTLSELMHLPSMENPQHHYQKSAHQINQTPNASNTSHLSALELLTGLTSSRGLMTPFMPMQIQDPNSIFPSGFNLQGDFKPTLNFSLDGLGGGGGGGGIQGVQENAGMGGRILFPFEDLKSATTTTTTRTTTAPHDHHQNHNSDQQIARDQQGDSTGYWTGMLGGAGSW